jgi:hypothetical protein
MDGSDVPVEAEPAKVAFDSLLATGNRASRVQVFDAKNRRAARALCDDP